MTLCKIAKLSRDLQKSSVAVVSGRNVLYNNCKVSEENGNILKSPKIFEKLN